MNIQHSLKQLKHWVYLLRWNKPSGRLILLIPAGWSLWLTPSAPPSKNLVSLIVAGAIFTSGAGCIINDLWDINIDKKVQRTKTRPLTSGKVKRITALILLIATLSLSCLVVFLLPVSSRVLCLKLAFIALGAILIYPSSKRWCKFPQVLLAICWGFSVLIPWSASESSLNGGWPLLSCWIGTMIWTFGFDTVYAMADQKDDKKIGLNSSALNLGGKALTIVSISYGLTSLLLGLAAFTSGISFVYWPIWSIFTLGMQREVALLKNFDFRMSRFSRHFQNQVLLGSLILLGLILGKS